MSNQIISEFYTAFNNLDAEKMADCYHDEIVFEDPAFGVLKGEKAKNMWRMLCESQKGGDFKVVFSNVEFNDEKGKAKWEAFYNFSKTGRRVHNIIEASFKFKDGLIIDHRDNFDLYRWSKQALGFKGTLLGWTAFFKKGLNKQTGHLLQRFEEKNKSLNQ